MTIRTRWLYLNTYRWGLVLVVANNIKITHTDPDGKTTVTETTRERYIS